MRNQPDKYYDYILEMSHLIANILSTVPRGCPMDIISRKQNKQKTKQKQTKKIIFLRHAQFAYVNCYVNIMHWTIPITHAVTNCKTIIWNFPVH